MALHARAILRSVVFSLVAGVILWPPVTELVYWSVFEALGDAVILPVLAASVVSGVGFGALTSTTTRSFAIGGALAYLIGMGGIEAILAPEGPVHFLLYGSMLVAVGIGVLIVRVWESESRRSTTGETGSDA